MAHQWHSAILFPSTNLITWQLKFSPNSCYPFVVSSEITDLSLKDFCAPGKSLRPSSARGLASILVKEIDGLSLEQLGKFLERDPSGLSKLANRLEIKSYHDSLIAKQIQEMREWIINPMSGCQA